MHTHHSSRSPTQSASNSPPQGHPQTISAEAANEALVETKHGQWSVQEESELIGFLSNHKAEAGDGANFKQAIWTQAATHMSVLSHSVQLSAQANGEGCSINLHSDLLIVIW